MKSKVSARKKVMVFQTLTGLGFVCLFVLNFFPSFFFIFLFALLTNAGQCHLDR